MLVSEGMQFGHFRIGPRKSISGMGVVELHETGEVLSKGFGTVTLASKWSLAKNSPLFLNIFTFYSKPIDLTP